MEKRLTRRSSLKLLAGSALALLPAVGIADRAFAGRTWCRVDPRFSVDGVVGNVFVSGLINQTYDTTGPIKLVFRVPTGSKVELISADSGFGQGYAVSVVHTSGLQKDREKVQVEVEVVVPAATSDLPVLVEIVPDSVISSGDRREGVTNQRIRVKTELKRAR